MTREEKEELIQHLKYNLEIGADYLITDKDAVEIIKALEQELCEDEYIKVPKKALKYRTAGMVAYNAEWLKNHFDIERAVICGVQEPKTEALDKIRAEVEALPKTYPFVNHIDMYVKEDDVRKIIDKYKAESEE